MIEVAQLNRIEAKLDRLIGPEPAVISSRQARELWGVRSNTSLYRAAKTLGIHPVTHGHWRRLDWTNAITQRAIQGAKKS
jgi:hypothetical protein